MSYKVSLQTIINNIEKDKILIEDFKKDDLNGERMKLIELSMELIKSFNETLKSGESLEKNKKSNDVFIFVYSEVSTRAYESLELCIFLWYHNRIFFSMSMLRDVVECEYLLKYFLLNPEKVEEWWKMDRGGRLKQYSPKKLREKLSQGDKKLQQMMNADYAAHSDIYSHISPNSINERYQNDLIKQIEYHLAHVECLHDIAIHSYRIAKTLVTILLSYDSDIKKEINDTGNTLLNILNNSYSIILQNQRHLIFKKYFTSPNGLHFLHSNKIIDYDDKGNLIIIDETKLTEAFEDFLKGLKDDAS